MMLRLSSLGCFLLVSFLSAGGLGVRCAQGQGTPFRRDIRIPEGNSLDLLTNSYQSKPRQDSLRDFERRLGKDQNPFSGSGELDTPPPQYLRPSAVAPSRRLKELLERQKNWMSTPGFVGPGNDRSREELFKTPGYTSEETDKKKSSVDQFYEALNHFEPDAAPRSDTKPDPKDRSDEDRTADGKFDFDLQDDHNLPSGIRQSVDHLQKTLSDDKDGNSSSSSASTRGTVSDFFGLGGNEPPTHEEMLAHKASVDRYNSVWDKDKTWGSSPSGVVGNPFLNPMTPTLSTINPNYATGSDPLGSLVRSPVPRPEPVVVPESSALSPSFGAIALPDFGGKALNSWNPASTAPSQWEPARIAAPLAAPPMDFPRRKFQ